MTIQLNARKRQGPFSKTLGRVFYKSVKIIKKPRMWNIQDLIFISILLCSLAISGIINISLFRCLCNGYNECVHLYHNFNVMRMNISRVQTNKGKIKGKVFYGQEPHSGESTTTESGVNYQLLAVITEVANGNFQLQSTTTSYGQWRQRRQIQLTGRTPHPHGQYPMSSTYCTVLTRPTNRKTCCTNPDSNAHQRTTCAATHGMRSLLNLTHQFFDLQSKSPSVNV